MTEGGSPGGAPARRDARSRILLRDEPVSDEPVVRPAATAGTDVGPGGRYRVVGEIARGGMGVVVKGHDGTLGRDVAIKVLREEYARREDVVQRFVEEAQIGGQLQHPGVVPVYELGVHADGRPFFTMKLVKGRTLSALLEERRDPSQDRRRFLAAFETVCETLAYAHARGVLHRDVKPANVMVGTFGEVQLMDWGLAKVLGHVRASERPGSAAPGPAVSVVATVRSVSAGSASHVGSVLGTPAYMSPEQARGEVDEVDERADVFALGAVLCEILTGRPPYVGSDHEIVEKAARADLTDARARLAACGADAEIVALCEACLSPSRDGRPRNAKAVAQGVDRHLATLEARARDARVAAALADVRAATAGRARRLTLAIVAAGVGAVVVAAGAFVVAGSRGASRRSEAERAAARELGEAERRAQEARATRDPAAWRDAVDAAARARGAVGDAAPEARSRIEDAAARIESDARGAGEAADARSRADAAAVRLDDVRASLGGAPETPADAARLAGALRAAGADADGDPQACVAAVRSSPHAPRLIAALDALTSLRARLGVPAGDAWKIATLADDDALRSRIRGTTDAASLRSLVAALGDLPDPAAACLLADRIGSGGDAAGAVAALREVRRRRPDDFWIEWTCGFWERRSDPPEYAAAARSDAAALALRPAATILWPRLAHSIARSGDDVAALPAATRALEVAPDSALAKAAAGWALLTRGDADAALAAFRESLERDPRFAEASSGLAEALERRGDLAGAQRAAEAAVAAAPADAACRVSLARACLARRDTAGARAAAAEALKLAPGRSDAMTAVARAAWLDGDFAELHRVAAQARAAAPDDGAARACSAMSMYLRGLLIEAHAEARSALDRAPRDPWAELALALVLDRRDDLVGADAHFRRAIEMDPAFAEAHVRLAAALRRRGRIEEAARERRSALDTGAVAPWTAAQFAALDTPAAGAAALLPRLGQVRTAAFVPRDAEERAAATELLWTRGCGVAASRLAASAPGDGGAPGDVPGARSDAARVCVLAALGWCLDGFDADEAEVASLLARARALLASDLDVCERMLGAPEQRAAAREALRSWRIDHDLARAADAAAKDEVPPDERDAWAALLGRRDALLARAQERRP